MRYIQLASVVAFVVLMEPVVLASDFDVVLSEIHYNPLSGLDRDEFVELFNRGPTTVDLGGWTFTEGIDLTIPAGTMIRPKEYLVVSPDASYAITRYGLPRALGDYKGKLDNDGEIIALANRAGDIMSRVHYGDEGVWLSRPDGLGPSLELLDPHAVPDVARSWATSLYIGGTPGAPNSLGGAEARSQVTVNEVRPSEGGNSGFIELYNFGANAFALGQHAIIDSAGHSFAVPAGTIVPSKGRAVFLDSQLGFSIALDGATYVLAKKAAGTGPAEFIDALKTRQAPAGSSGLSFGRVPDGGDDIYLMSSPSQGTANTVTLTTDIVFNEIQFHPPFVPPGGGCDRRCSDAHQWIELHNRGASAIDVAGWSISKGVDLTIPAAPALSIPAGGFLVLASSRTTFLADHPAFDPSRVVGDWSRDLSRDSDTINLNDALANRVDHVKYGDGGPLNDVAPADGVDDRTFIGSEWPTTADGTGRTIELVNPHLDNRDGGAWAAGPIGGTPGAVNASFAAVPFAVIGDVGHSPAVPRPTDAVTVACRVSATQAVSAVEVIWHREGAAGGGTVTLKDDGLSGDGAAGDGQFAGAIPAQPDKAVVGFQVRARLADGKTTTLPRAPAVSPYAGFTGPFYLYQVLATAPPINPSENYYVVMADADLNELESRPITNDVLLPCTFIHVAKDGSSSVRHLAGIRYRGAATRQDSRKPYRIDFPSEQTFEDIQHMNLNSAQVEHELLVSDLFRRAGMPYPREWSVNLTVQGNLDPRYIVKEHMDSSFLNRFFGSGSDSGNFYRAIDPDGDPRAGDLTYYGPDPADYVTYYQKQSNKEENDYSDIIELCRAFDRTQTPDNIFPDLIETLIDTNEWARYLAIQACLSNTDGSIQTNSGEDYFLYKVPVTSKRPDAGRWILVPWDIEETFANANEQLFRPQLASVRRFLTNPRFAPLYYGNLINLRDGAFSRFETRQRFGLIDFLFGFSTIDAIDTFITARIGFVDSNVPIELSAGAVGTTTGTPLVQIGETWKYWKGTTAPAGAAFAWTQGGYTETGWLSGPTGIGYGDGDDATVLSDMLNTYSTVYARKTFDVTDPSAIHSLDLVIDYDDGFVAYLNGAEVARRNAPGAVGSAVPPDALAPQGHEAGTAEAISLNAALGSLVAGSNVIAVQALNAALSSTDLSLLPELRSGSAPSGGIGCGTVLYSTTDTIALLGRANAYLTGSIKVNGTLASYDPYQAVWSATVSLSAGDNLVVVEAFEGPNGVGNRIEAKTLTVRRLTRPPTSVTGTLTGATRWTADGGPYLMPANVTIPAGSRLDIDPGTLVIGEAGASIIVRGEIQALGTEASPILFRALSCGNRWGGIAIDGTGLAAGDPTSTLRYCDLEFGNDAAGFTGCVSPVQSKVLVDHCSFRFLTANAVNGTNARVEVRSSLFEKINEGVHCTSSTVIILDSTFRGMTGDKDGIDFDLNGTERSRIERCLIEDGSDDGIDLAQTTVDIRDNVIRNISDKGMSLETDGPLGPPTVTGNLVYNSGTGIALKSGLHLAESFHNTVVGCQEGLNLFAKAGASDGGHGTFDSLIVWSNNVDVKLDALSDASFSFSDISSGVWPGAGNISSDPKFINVAADDYALRAASPCIGTGKDSSDMGAIPFTGSAPTFIRADSNGSGGLDITDVVFTLDYLFRSGTSPSCLDSADANDDGSLDIADAVFTLFHLFAGGSSPPPPFPGTGEDPTPDGLPCGG